MQSTTRRSLSVVVAMSLVAATMTGCVLTPPSVDDGADQLREVLEGTVAVSAVTVLDDSPESSYWNFPGGSPRAVGLVEVELGESWETSVEEVSSLVQGFLAERGGYSDDLLSVVLATPDGDVGITESSVETAARVALLRSLAADDGVTGWRIAYPDIRPVDGDDVLFVIQIAPDAGLVDTFTPHESVLKAAAEASDSRTRLVLLDHITVDVDERIDDDAIPATGGRYFESVLIAETSTEALAFADGMDVADGVVGWSMDWGSASVIVGDAQLLPEVRQELRALPEFALVNDDGFPIVSGLELSLTDGSLRVDSDVLTDSAEYRFGSALHSAGAEQVRVWPGALRLGSRDGSRLQQLVEAAVPAAPDAGWVLLTTSIGDIQIRQVPIDFTMLILPDLLAVDPNSYRQMSVTAEDGYMVELGSDGDPSEFLSAVYIPAAVEGMPVVVKQTWSGPSVTFVGAERISERDLMAFEDHETSVELNAAVLGIWNELVLPEPTAP